MTACSMCGRDFSSCRHGRTMSNETIHQTAQRQADRIVEQDGEIERLREIIGELLELPIKHPQQNEIKDRARSLLSVSDAGENDGND